MQKQSLADLVAIRRFPAVVQSHDIGLLRETAREARAAVPDADEVTAAGEEALSDFVGGYLGYDERARHALETSMRSLAGAEGGAFFFNGVFGSGKSHLLGLLILLADGAGWTAFGETHPHLRPLLGGFKERFVVSMALDDYAAARHSLEEIFWRETRREWERTLGTKGLPPILAGEAPSGSRAEAFAELEEAVAAEGRAGIVLCIDELSLFLAGREHHALQNDAAFLQFLGQRARRRGGGLPLWIFAALQKTVEDIGDLDAYAISQIRDRFVTLPLSLAHLPSLIERRLIIRRDAAALRRLCDETYESRLKALPRLDFGRDEWARLYPFHPATIALLEQIAPRFLSRTRSAVLFCAGAVRESDAATTRVLPSALFDYVEPEMNSHPDLRPLATVWQNWIENEKEVARDAEEAAALRALVRVLILGKIAGNAPSIVQLVHAADLDLKLPGDGNYEYGRILLEKLRSHAPVVVERRDGEFADRYTLDFGARVGEMARRFSANALHNLAPRDRRIARYTLRCCRDAALPLASLENALAGPFWRNAQRNVQIEVVTSPPAPELLANRIAALAAPGSQAEWLLFIVPPFVSPEDEVDEEVDSEMAGLWREAIREGVRRSEVCEVERWRHAVVWWLPRSAGADEWRQAREATAQHLLLSDPQLHDNRRGRAVLEYLKNGLAEREEALGRLGTRLLREGVLATGGGVVIEAAELAGRENWSTTLDSIAEWTLPAVFPRWQKVAPRLRVLTPSNADTLCLEILRRPADAPYFAASHDRLARAVGEPLGIAVEERGRWRIASPHDELAAEIKRLVETSGSATLAALETELSLSRWGLPPVLTRIVLCALLRSGELAALDARGEILAPLEIGMPLARSVRAFQLGHLFDGESWDKIRRLTGLLTGTDPGPRSFAAQEKAHLAIAAWREDARATTELARARLHQLRRVFGSGADAWTHGDASGETVTALIHALEEKGTAPEVLGRLLRWDEDELAPALGAWQKLAQRLDERHAFLLEAQSFLAHPYLSAPAALKTTREELLARLSVPETALEDETLPQDFTTWRNQYAALYAQWHENQNAPARWNSLRRLAASDELRALDALSNLRYRLFPHAGEIREKLSEETVKHCAHDGRLGREPICPSCRLRLEERLILRDPAEIGGAMDEAASAFRAALQEEPVWAHLERAGELVAPLCDWATSDGSLANLWTILDAATLYAVDEAFRPRRVVTRSFDGLREALASCHTRADWEAAFGRWLDAGENLQPDDEVLLDAGERA